MEWSDVADEFVVDGALRDIYLTNTSIQEWQAVFDAVRAAYQVTLSDSDTIPDDVKLLLNWEELRTLTVDPEGLDLHCHFFTEQEIEFDFHPRALTSQAELDKLCRFLELISRASQRSAIVTMENAQDWVILSYDAKIGQVVRGRR